MTQRRCVDASPTEAHSHPEEGIVGQQANRSEPSEHDVDRSENHARVSRRAVLRAGTLGAAAVGAVTAFPTLFGDLASAGPALQSGAAEAPAVATEAESVAALEGPIVAHIRDAATGELSLYVGEREIVYRDPGLIHQLTRAAR
jgi:hypothetical protein